MTVQEMASEIAKNKEALKAADELLATSDMTYSEITVIVYNSYCK